uniref:Secreted protein n=1 Tax=Pseudomonas phage vB_PaeS_HTN2 TaxID=3236647 RepID=A0AB39AID1_9VIRU
MPRVTLVCCWPTCCTTTSAASHRSCGGRCAWRQPVPGDVKYFEKVVARVYLTPVQCAHTNQQRSRHHVEPSGSRVRGSNGGPGSGRPGSNGPGRTGLDLRGAAS